MATFAIDIDDTLYGFGNLARKVMADEGFRLGDQRLIAGSYAPWAEWRSPVDLVGLDEWLRIIALCHDDEKILSQVPYEGAVETLWGLVNSGHNLMYISNRATETEAATLRWLVECGFPIDVEYYDTTDGERSIDLIVTSEDKKPFVAHCQYLIDDRPKTQIAFLTDGEWDGEARKVYALATEFNRAMTDVPGIYLAPTWYGIQHYLERHGLLSSEKIPA
jgi:hypothetical protein